jgi:cytochrome c556
MSQAMIDSAKAALQAAEARDTEGILAAGEGLNTSCDNCHRRYPPPE